MLFKNTHRIVLSQKKPKTITLTICSIMKHFMQEIGKNFISFMISLPLKLRYSQEYFQPKIGTKIRILSLGYKKQYSHTL